MEDLFQEERIPKIAVAADGTILAFADGCRLLRRSDDRGETWSQPQTVNAEGAGNAIVDETSGDVLIVCPP
ncbi:MAG: sialidase family protein, partial [Armatimonadota bacterium]